MEKESENTLDLVLDIQNSSLNPFDRPPNIMDDDLNSVTQEELEANLSTDCPQSNMESTTPTSLEQLIQSVLEDTSTQDAVEQQDQYIDTRSRDKCSSPESEILGTLTNEDIKAETETAEDDGCQQNVAAESLADDVDNILEDVHNDKADLFTSASNETVEKLKENTIDDDGLATTIKEDQLVLDISVGSEQLLTQNVDNCYYADTIQEDIDNGAAEQQDRYSDASSRGICSSPESETLGILTKEDIKAETETAEDDGCQQSVAAESLEDDVDNILENVHNDKAALLTSPSNETVEKSKEHTIDHVGLDTTIKEEEQVLYISLSSEKLLTKNVDNSYYADTIQEDIDNELCEVEVCDGGREIKEESSDENEDDNLSNASSLSIGRLVENDNVSQLSIINNDHCYSQEKVSTNETSILKQNLLNYMLQKNPKKNNHEKISSLVDKLFNGLDNDNMEMLLNSIDMIQEPLITSDTFTDGVRSKNQDEHVSSTIKKTTEEEATVTKADKSENVHEFNSTDIDVNLVNQEVEVAGNLDISQESQITDTYTSEEIAATSKESNEITTNQIDKEQPLNEVNVPMEHENVKSTALPTESVPIKDDNHPTTSQGTENVTTQESIDSKSVSESLADNCSEPLEHYILEEEFELLCQNGNLTLDKYKTDISSHVLKKLTDFVTNMQKDCQSFSSASTNIEQRLHHYIRQQFEHFQETFKSFCCTTTSINKKSIETQTDFKKLTKHHRREMNMESKKNLLKTSDKSSQSSSSSIDDEDLCFNKAQKRKRIKRSSAKNKPHSSDSESASRENEKSDATAVVSTAPLSSSQTSNILTNLSQEYDDGVNLSQYVQSEIFDIESASQQSPLPSSVDDSDASVKEENGDEAVQSNYLVEDSDSCSTILYKPKKKSATNPDVSGLSSSDTKILRKSRNDDMSVNSESDKENVSSGRNDKKSHDSMDEDEKNDKEIERLINIDGLAKRSIANSTSTKSSEKSKSKAPTTKNLNDPFDFMDVEFGSDDEVKSEAEEEVITEKQFLERRNEDIKRQMLDDSSSGSEESNEEDDELLKGASEEDDESGKNSPLVEKFLKSFVVDDSDNDNDVVDEDDDIDLDSDKEATASSTVDTTNKADEPADLATKETEVNAGDENETKKANNSIEADGDSPTASDIELLNDNLLFRKRGSRPQKLDKMLSDAEKRKRISKIDEELISLSSDTENSDVEAIDVEPSQSTKPRAIKPMLRPDQLAGETIKAQKHENERISRLERKHNMLDKILKDHPDADKNKELILDYIKDSKTFIKVHPGIVKHLKPHQFDGVRFMYDSCYGGVDSLKKSPGSGCILAHCMGLGKTLQLIALLHTVISFKELKTTKILVLCPKSTVMNWADEIIRWLGPLRQKNLKVYTFNDTSDIYEKLSILREWSLSNHTRAGCLLIGYEAFRTLVFYHSYKNRGNISAHRLEEIRKNVNTYLLQPGADLVICDEGHIIKNSKSAISTAVAQIVTPRRIVLTGTPIQNNLKEYYSMVNFIKPLFLGTEKEFANLYANPIKNGQHKDSGKTDIKVMKQRSFVLHKKLSKFVQRKEAELLKTFLPQKFEYVLFIPMTDVQNNLYQHILNTITNRDETYRGKGLITDYTCLRKIWTHPKVLEDAWKNAVNQRNKKELRQKQKDHNSEDDQPDDIYDSQTGQMSVTNDWWRSLVTETDLESVMPSNKLRTMFKILQMCEEKGEKCLIFSAFVAVLNVVEYFFRKITDNDQTVRNELTVNSHSQWVLGKDYYRLDGKTPKSIRHAMINEFNNVLNKRARVFLISAKAGGQGINLIGANRVMILDTSWNPSNDQQNIFRVFRLGQKRNCYIYRLLAMGTMEEKVYSRSVTKQAMSFRVVDEQQIDRHYNMAELAELYILTIPDHNNRPTPILPQDSVLARLLRSFPDLVYKYHEHDSLLENKVEQELSEQEKNEAWTAYERDLQMNSEIRELPNMDELQNKFNPSNLANYMSPFSGLDVSNTANTNNIPKNMSHFFGGPRGFTQPLLQSLLGPNSNAATTQQYIEMFNYYKNLGTYADLNSYSTLSAMGAGRMPGGPSTSSAANPLAALGDLSMYGLGSPALQGLGPSTANSMNLANSVLANALPPMPTPPSSASMYTSSAPSMLASTANAALSSAGLTNTTNSAAALTAFEQYTQSLRSSFPNMYSYAGDFGIGSSGSTILDKSKSAKNAKHSSSGSNSKNTTNLPGGSKGGGGSSMSLYPGSSVYLTQHQQQSRPSSRNTPTESASKAKTTSTSASGSMPTPSSNSMTTSSSANSMAMAQHMSNSSKTNTNDVPNSLINYRRSESTGSNSIPPSKPTPVSNQKRGHTDFPNGSGVSKAAGSLNSTPNSKQPSKSLNPTPPIQPTTNQNNPQKSSSLGTIGPRSTKSSNVDNNRTMNMVAGSTKSSNVDNNRPMNMAANTTKSSNVDNSRPMNMAAGSTKSSNVDNSRPMNMAAGSTKSSNVDNSRPMNMAAVSTKTSNMENSRSIHVATGTSKSSNVDNNRSIHVATGSTKTSNVDNSRSVNMGILYPNSKTSSTKSNSPMNMGIVYPRSGKSSTSEMQIIPTSSPPGTTSISKQLNDLSPSISLTAVKNTGPTKSANSNTKSSTTTTPQTMQINKVIQNNTTIRRTTSPVTASAANNSKSSPTNSNNSSITGTNQGSLLARLKVASNKKATNAGNSNTNPPPLHRANSTLGTTSTSSAVNITAKSTSGLTITNVKPPMKSQNAANKPQVNTSANQASTFAKQQAAASVAKSNIQRTSTPTSNVINPTSNTSSLQKNAKSLSLPSLTSIKRTIIKRASPNTSGTSNKLPALSSSSVTVTSSNKLPIISSVKSISPSMATISKASLGKTNLAGTLQNKQNLQSVSNVSKTIAQMQKRLPSSMTASAAGTSSAAANSTANTVRNTVNIRPVDNKQNSSGIGGGVYIIETNINDKKVAIGAPTKSGGGTTVTKVPLQNPNKRKATDPLPKDISIDSKRMKN